MKKITIFLLTIILLLPVVAVGAYYTGYPIDCTENELKQKSFDVYVYENDTGYVLGPYDYLGSDYLANNLKVWEHASHGYDNEVGKLYTPKVITSTRFLDAWETMRADINDPITVASGYRNVRHNAMLDNSAEQSQHQAGITMDVQTPYGEADDWLAQIYEWGFEWGYKISETAIHVDTRWTTSNFPTLYVLDQNPYVFTLEDGMKHHNYDNIFFSGFYGTSDEDVVKNFQSDNGLTVDGIVGQNTWRAILPD